MKTKPYFHPHNGRPNSYDHKTVISKALVMASYLPWLAFQTMMNWKYIPVNIRHQMQNWCKEEGSQSLYKVTKFWILTQFQQENTPACFLATQIAVISLYWHCIFCSVFSIHFLLKITVVQGSISCRLGHFCSIHKGLPQLSGAFMFCSLGATACSQYIPPCWEIGS